MMKAWRVNVAEAMTDASLTLFTKVRYSYDPWTGFRAGRLFRRTSLKLVDDSHQFLVTSFAAVESFSCV